MSEFSFRYVLFKFGLQYISLANCTNQVLFQYSYDNGIQWYTKKVLDGTNNVVEKFDDLLINMNIYLRWIEENGNRLVYCSILVNDVFFSHLKKKDYSCLMWNLRSISIRTTNDDNLWYENNLNIKQKNPITYEAQTWEFSLIESSSIIQFDLQMFPVNNKNDTDWYLSLEISSDIIYGWSSWVPLIPRCNQTNVYCEDNVVFTGSLFLAQSYLKQRSVMIPIPDHYV